MRRLQYVWIACVNLLATSIAASGAQAAGIVRPGSVKIQDIVVDTPAGFTLAQEAIDQGTILALFAKETVYVRLYARRGAAQSLDSFMGHGSTVTRRPTREQIGGRDWMVMETTKAGANGAPGRAAFGFSTEQRGIAYFGYAAAATATEASHAARAILAATH